MHMIYEMDARRIDCETQFPGHRFGFALMMDRNKEASALYASVGAEIKPGTTFRRVRDDALRALAA